VAKVFTQEEREKIKRQVVELVRQKINAAQDLKWANEARAKQAENLSALEQDITRLEKAAALSIARMITYPR
jgi:hypothetical protein